MLTNENNFIQRLKQQKEDALDFIVDRYLPLIRGVTYKVLSPLEDDGLIDECINDILLSIWNNSKKFHGGSIDFKKWICAIAKYKSIDYYRKSNKKVEIIKDVIDLNHEKSAEDELIIMEEKTELIKLINLLEPMDRDIFMMKFFLGIKTEDISLKLGLTNASIDNRIYRGKKKLYNKAKKHGLRGGVL
ncbi:sigma-70 family RNA polymerase sigma factor [Paenibacillus protaetiae]|uniref:Sigma-70 family RNA polymerase sigma factor n=1 Tax=Paenibacillus protaetiae TaxID=2509456 RepID=A0A4P6EWL8_9BACL|nr:sigma-70 family RNA polymerase sigma factor [Paenibacillus protaetiae]QAY67392.1 sigma-70 family RNA polymerase sigma factor [Paenibacillus protaetiae]